MALRGGRRKKKMRQLYTVVMQCVAGSHTHIFIHRSRVEELWPCRGVLLNLSRQFPPLLTNHTHIRKQTQIDGFLFVPQSELDPGSRLNLTLTTNSNRERKYCVWMRVCVCEREREACFLGIFLFLFFWCDRQIRGVSCVKLYFNVYSRASEGKRALWPRSSDYGTNAHTHRQPYTHLNLPCIYIAATLTKAVKDKTDTWV